MESAEKKGERNKDKKHQVRKRTGGKDHIIISKRSALPTFYPREMNNLAKMMNNFIRHCMQEEALDAKPTKCLILESPLHHDEVTESKCIHFCCPFVLPLRQELVIKSFLETLQDPFFDHL